MPVKGTAFNKPGVNRKFADACKRSAAAARERAQARDELDPLLAEALGLLAPLKRERASVAGQQVRQAFKCIRAGRDPFLQGALPCPSCKDPKETHAITCFWRKQKPSEPEYSVWGEVYDVLDRAWREQLERNTPQVSAGRAAVCKPCAVPTVESQCNQAAATSAALARVPCGSGTIPTRIHLLEMWLSAKAASESATLGRQKVLLTLRRVRSGSVMAAQWM
jgi:hypothetical protein